MTDRHPDIRIVAGEPDDDEVAAVTLVLLVLAGGSRPDPVAVDPPSPQPSWGAVTGYQAPASWVATIL